MEQVCPRGRRWPSNRELGWLCPRSVWEVGGRAGALEDRRESALRRRRCETASATLRTEFTEADDCKGPKIRAGVLGGGTAAADGRIREPAGIGSRDRRSGFRCPTLVFGVHGLARPGGRCCSSRRPPRADARCVPIRSTTRDRCRTARHRKTTSGREATGFCRWERRPGRGRPSCSRRLPLSL